MPKNIIIHSLAFSYAIISFSSTYADQTLGLLQKSDNPEMFLTAKELAIKPLSAPSSSKYQVETNETVVFDRKAQEEIVLSNDPIINTQQKQEFKPYRGILPSHILSARVIGSDDRSRITNPVDFPWRTFTKLKITFPDGYTSGCSGAIIDDFHVLTVGHCVYSLGHGGYGDIKVFPGLDRDYMPFSYANSTFIRTYTQWTTNRDPDHDWALITLDRNIGFYTGWMGIKTAPKESELYKNALNVSGYPNDRLDNTLWNSFETGHSANEFQHYYTMDTYGGESGAPVWQSENGEQYILSIHAFGNTADTPDITNGGTRINQEKYDRLSQWLANDQAPIDKSDLIDDGDRYSNYSPNTITAGETLSVYNDIRNIGTEESGDFYISYFASTDTTITEDDYYLGKKLVPSISPFAKTTIKWSNSLPHNISGGEYYIGWIIDSSNLSDEFNETNNTGYKAAEKMTIIGKKIPTITLVSPSGKITDSSITFTWKKIPEIENYQLSISDSTGNIIEHIYQSTSLACEDSSNRCSITLNVALENGKANWKVRTWDNNTKEYGIWSKTKQFDVFISKKTDVVDGQNIPPVPPVSPPPQPPKTITNIPKVPVVVVKITDKTAPIIILMGATKLNLFVGDKFKEPGFSVSDNTDKNVNVTVIGSVNTNKAGTYTLTYKATDTSGNIAIQQRTVTISKRKDSPSIKNPVINISAPSNNPKTINPPKPTVVKVVDVIAPKIILSGAPQLILTIGDKFEEPGFSASDNHDKKVKVIISGSVDTNKAGTYTLIYKATDTSGNTTIKKRTILVSKKKEEGEEESSNEVISSGGGSLGFLFFFTLLLLNRKAKPEVGLS